jgi:hypothetical protein
MRWLAVAACLLCAVPPALAAPFISINAITPNPGGQASKIKGNGFWNLDAGWNPNGIAFDVMLKGTTQHTWNWASAARGNPNNTWECTLTVAAGTYNPCTATLYWIDPNNMPGSTPVANNQDQVVL